MQGVELPTTFSKKGGLDRISICTERLLGKRGLTCFKGGGGNKLKSVVFNDKKKFITKRL